MVNSGGTTTQDSNRTEVAATVTLENNDEGFPVGHKERDEGYVKEVDDADPKIRKLSSKKLEGQRKEGHT